MSAVKPLEQMSTSEKIQMMEALWNDLCRHADSIESPAWHQGVLAQREESLRTGEEAFEDWESTKETIREEIH